MVYSLCCSLSSDGERILTDLLSSPGFSTDFFEVGGEKTSVTEEKVGETVRIACLDIGSYRPEDMKWCVEGEHVLLQGKRTSKLDKGLEGAKFSRAIPIPKGVDPKQITTRFSSLDGQYIIEGVKIKTERPGRRASTAFYDETKMTLTVDLGSARAQELVFQNEGSAANCLSRNGGVFVGKADKIEI